MAYIHKIIGKDETLIGIARLHWIHVIRGLGWFGAFALGGYLINMGLISLLGSLTRAVDHPYIPASAIMLSNVIMIGMLGAGFLTFMWFVIRVMSDYVALLDRRVIYKRGMLFVTAQEVDIEEIRAEHLDLGWFGRFLGYGKILMDCRFIGDVTLPAIENPERFIRALHYQRTNAQDALNLVMGKSNVATPVNIVGAGEQGPQQPEVQPPQPEPEVQPPRPDQIPTPPNQPMPNAPPPMDREERPVPQKSATVAQRLFKSLGAIGPNLGRDRMKAPASLEQVRAQGLPEGDASKLPPQAPVLGASPESMQQQPQQQMQTAQQLQSHAPAQQAQTPIYNAPQQAPVAQAPMQAAPPPVQQQVPAPQQAQAQPQVAPMQAAPAPTANQSSAPAAPQGKQQAPLDPQTIAQVVEQVAPQIREQVLKDIGQQTAAAQPQIDNGVDNDLIHVFDEASIKKADQNDTDETLEYAIH